MIHIYFLGCAPYIVDQLTHDPGGLIPYHLVIGLLIVAVDMVVLPCSSDLPQRKLEH